MVTLQDFKSGLQEKDLNRSAGSNDMAATRCTFRLESAGRTNQSWRPVSVDISDATGNKWTPQEYLSTPGLRDGLADLAFRGTLWAGEPAWKLRFEFSQIVDFEPDEMFSFSNLVEPDANQLINLENSTNFAGTLLQLIALSGEAAEQPGNLQRFAKQNYANLSIRLNPAPQDRRLTLVRVVDENGLELELAPAEQCKHPERVFGFKNSVAHTRLSFTFALHKSRFVEFLARPDFPPVASAPSSN